MAEAVFSVDVWLSGREYLRAVQSCFASPRNVERAGDYTGFLFSLQLRWIPLAELSKEAVATATDGNISSL